MSSRAEHTPGDHLDFVNVVEVEGREDPIYVFADQHAAGRFHAAVAAGLNASDESLSPLAETPINVGDAAERLIAAERADVLEDMGHRVAAEAMREGFGAAIVYATLASIDAPLHCIRLVQRWAEEDETGGES